MSEVINKVKLAQRELGRSIIYLNPNINIESEKKNKYPLYFGIKDTNQIPEGLIEKVRNHEQFLWLTVDKASNRGRAIDTDLINPITYRVMTGSTSGGPINIVKGINDFAIGTDGGGSVLAPAMSCQLPAIIGGGLGLHVNQMKSSTDGISFIGSVGVIGKSVEMLRKVMECIVDENLSGKTDNTLKVVIPKKGTVTCPDGHDMFERIMSYLEKIDLCNYLLEEVDMTGINDRKRGIEVIQDSFEQKCADLIITCEGPVDVYGYGETIPQFLGEPGRNLTHHHGKYLMRAANMCQTTAITVPIDLLASGLLITAKKGVTPSIHAINLAEKLEKMVSMPEVWKRYIIQESHFSGLELRK